MGQVGVFSRRSDALAQAWALKRLLKSPAKAHRSVLPRNARSLGVNGAYLWVVSQRGSLTRQASAWHWDSGA
jgi:hypothetical protein